MANWWGEVTSAPKSSAPPGGAGTNWWKEATAPTVPVTDRDPDIQSNPSKSVGLGARFVSGFSSGEDETVRYYASQLYPDEPLEKSASRFGVRDGRLFHRADDGSLYEAVPSKGMASMAGSVAAGVGKAIPAAAGLVAGIATAPLATTGIGLAGTMGAAYAGGAGGEAARQKIGDVMMGDASTGSLDPLSIAGEGLYSAAGQVGGTGIGRMAERSQVRDISRLNPAATNRTYGLSQRYGVDVTPGQATGLKTLQAEEKRLATRDPQTMDQMQDFLRTQSDDVQGAWRRQLGTIAPERDAEETGNAIRTAAKAALKDVTAARSKAASPLYKEAFAKNQNIESREIDQILETPAGQRALENARIKMQNDRTLMGVPDAELAEQAKESGQQLQGGAASGLKLRTLHYVRRSLADDIDAAVATGRKDDASILIGLKNDLTRAMDDADVTARTGPNSTNPKGGLYKQARGVYSELSDDVDDAFGSALGRIAKLNDTNILNVVRETFNPDTRSPVMIARLNSVLSKKDPAAWQDLKRLWLQDHISDGLKTAQSGEVLNPAGKILSALEDPGTSRSIKAALNPMEQSSLEDVKFFLRRISSAKLGMGSDTAANLAADKAALEKATGIWARAGRKVATILNPLSWAQGIDRVADASAERNLRNQASEMVRLVTSGDPDAVRAMRELRKLTPGQWRALAASGQLGVRGLPVAINLGSRAIQPSEARANE